MPRKRLSQEKPKPRYSPYPPYQQQEMESGQPKIVYYNATPHPLNELVEDPENGDIEGKVGNGPLTKFRAKHTIPVNKEIRLIPGKSSGLREEDGFLVSDYVGWGSSDMDFDDLVTAMPPDMDHMVLFVSLPTAQFLSLAAQTGQHTRVPSKPVKLWTPDSGPTSCVRDDGGRILGVLHMLSFGELRY